MIVVTGVHRSGTSAVSMTLEALGVDFGPHEAFYGADQWNERGYFERNDVVDLNSRLLTGFPRTQGKATSLLSQIGYLLIASPAGVRRRAQRLAPEIAELAGRLDGIAVKDPRFCLTLDAWEQHVTSSIICLRHPAAVAKSLHRRQRVPLALGYRFWNSHAEPLIDAPPATTLFLDFDALSGEDPASELQRVLTFLNLDVTLDKALTVLGEQYTPGLRHFSEEGTDQLPVKTRRLWAALQQRRDAQSESGGDRQAE